ncbi:MAG: polysaccharide pyruvyl transferase CsaB, partial [Firmicutes bacterium]|nr:polysaccharide pyruvyl transferase CsaB [Bacillota bacterium]
MKKYSILMALNGLDIGGAETHVVELSKELARKGHRIIVASNGGVYEKELEEAGIKHYKVPMARRTFSDMKKSYFLLKDVIKKENVDIVHAHARIPGFLCGLIHKKMNFTFVTTAHWVFDTSKGLKYLTNWGQKSVAVSDDIKKYLIDNYGIKHDNIYVTINGIDTNKFSPESKGEKIVEELGLGENENRIVYVSRMDEDRALAAKQLIEITEKLDKAIPNLKIIIAGGGNVFDKLNAMANDVNERMGKKCIYMLGGRTDINEIVACGDVFVGVSRAALEAMAAEKPVVVAGNEGYIGVFEENKLALAQENNFCCRGCEMSSGELLYRDLVYMFGLDEEEKAKLGRYGREVIKQYYSVMKMADDCVVAYDAAYAENHNKQYNVLMSGYYGFNNSGDDAILLSIHANLKKLGNNIKITVLANNPEVTKGKYGVDVVDRYNALSVISAVRKCDVFISGGGSLLQDRTSTRSIVYYLSIIKLAKLMGKKVMLYANGIGPVEKPYNRNLVKRVVNKVDLITLREQNSCDELRSMGVDNESAFVTADPVFTMEAVSKEESFKLLKKEGIPTDKPIVGVSVRNWKNLSPFAEDLAVLCDRIH